MEKFSIKITDTESGEVYADELTDCILGVCEVDGGVHHLVASGVSTELLAMNVFMLKCMIDDILDKDVRLATIVEGLEDAFGNTDEESEEE